MTDTIKDAVDEIQQTLLGLSEYIVQVHVQSPSMQLEDELLALSSRLHILAAEAGSIVGDLTEGTQGRTNLEDNLASMPKTRPI